MKRRNLLLGASAGLAAPAIIGLRPVRAAANLDPNRLKDELTPFGAERAASASGMVPAWTGGATDAKGWVPGQPAPNLFAGQTPSYTVTQQNMAQYAHMLSDGQQRMLTRFGSKGYKLHVYPTERTAAAPQFVYDNIALNVNRIQPGPAGILFGFQGGHCGAPYPILSDDPAIAGIQVIWNNQTCWEGVYINGPAASYIGGGGHRPVLSSVSLFNVWWRYYDQSLTVAEYEAQPASKKSYFYETAPANQVGELLAGYLTTQSDHFPPAAFEYLVGEGRVREAPDIEYDVPVAQYDDVLNADEVNCWEGKMDRYNWRLVGKKEMIVPYNQWQIYNSTVDECMGPDTVNMDLIRNEVHRVWVVEATLAPGKRHPMPFRRFYVDEDTWIILMTDGYDAQGNYWRMGQNWLQAHPELPGTHFNIVSSGFDNMQSNSYVMSSSFAGSPPYGGFPLTYTPTPHSRFDVQNLANSGGL